MTFISCFSYFVLNLIDQMVKPKTSNPNLDFCNAGVLIQNLAEFCQFHLKILSRDQWMEWRVNLLEDGMEGKSTRQPRF